MTIRRASRALAGSAALALTALGAVGPADAGPLRRAADPTSGRPTVGTCSRMTAAQADSNADRSPRVACSEAHTAQVAGVVKLPRTLHWKTASRNALFRVVADRCVPKVDAMLGRDNATRDSSAYQYVWFEPTKRQRRRGARWLSCSIVLRQAKTLANLPTSTAPFLPSGALKDGVRRCLTKRALTTRCKATHLWRATGTFSLTGKYPGTDSLNKKANRRCARRVYAGRRYRWTYRDRISWNVGHDHVVVCYSKTRT
ncbi:MAG: septum formation family protein [Nocardioides sp.]|nr:septum formation family protein [Nocardioides sp.]